MVIDNLLCTRSTTLSGIRNVVYPSLEPRLGALAFEYVGARCIPADHASLISLFFGQEGLCRAYTVTFCVPMDEGRERTDGVLVHMRCLRM